MLQWMVWTPPTAVFFVVMGLMLVGMTVWELASPSVPRPGILPMATTRGDRLFIGLLGAAFINLAWLGITDWSQWGGLAVSVVWLLAIMRWG